VLVTGLNLLVVVTKSLRSAAHRSLAVLGAALESGLDFLNNLPECCSWRCRESPDEGHPYGHAKFESLPRCLSVPVRFVF